MMTRWFHLKVISRDVQFFIQHFNMTMDEFSMCFRGFKLLT